ncbi:MAG: pyruvate, phosphate dikinase [Culturomica sp.]|jgi:hypothetical protein|nr:pyruvate, phosphate dikinase [Culturomica sp.]
MPKIDLDKIYKRERTERDIFQDLMAFKVKEILVISTYYDAYTIDREGQFTDKVYGEYLQVNLYTAPRFISVTSEKEALEVLNRQAIHLIIIMSGLDKETPIRTSHNIKELFPNIPQMMLVNNNSDLAYFYNIEEEISKSIKRMFVWNGSTKVFLAMCKYIEDMVNLKNDTQLGDIRLMLIVEDSVRYYSRYLPLLYTEIMTQTQELIKKEPNNDDMSLIMKIRTRPKVILVSTFEEATEIIDRYKDYLLCVISDVKYKRNGVEDENAGIDLIKYTRSVDSVIPCLLQSHDIENAKRAKEVNAEFIHKNSVTLSHDIQKYIKDKLGFGDFIFKDKNANPIDKASSIEEFKQKLYTIPDESIEYHSVRNGISMWFMARGEISLAKKLRRYPFDYFKNVDDVRQFFIHIFENSEIRKRRGRIVNFQQKIVDSNRYVIRLGKGSLGGKGRGMAFLSNFIEHVNIQKLIPDLDIHIPKTAIIGVDEYDNFIEINQLIETIYFEKNYSVIKEAFLKGVISASLRNKLYSYLEVMKKPLAVRSSGLLEDSLNQPFAGVYATYLIPNNNPDIEKRLEDLEKAIKLVYASIYTQESRAYFQAVDYVIEEEKMAIIIQEVIGNEYNGKYYPNISGVAQSYNFYPFSYIQPEDGFAVIALGLGSYVVGGEKTCRFSPRYPKLQLASIKDMARDSQKYFYAIDMSNQNYNLAIDGENAAIKRYDIKEVEKDGNLNGLATVYDFLNDRILYDLSEKGIRIVNFPGILEYGDIKLPQALDILLDIFNQAMGAPVEIEFSLNIENGKPVLYLLQIKPLMKLNYNIDVKDVKVEDEHVVLKATKCMGNGKITDISDVVYIVPERFNKLKTEKIAKEVKKINQRLTETNTPYILVGPGRWGTRDPLTGIPVNWSDISKAKVIVEQGMSEFPLDASLGSHFFHNVTSMNVGYISIPYITEDSFINFDLLSDQIIVEEKEYVRHVHFRKPFTVLMSGRQQRALIYLTEKGENIL